MSTALLSAFLLTANLSAPNPSDPGAIDSPEAFLMACNARSVFDEMRKAATPDELSQVTSADEEFASVVVGMSEGVCLSIIRSVADTVRATDYRIDGRAVCFDPETPVTAVIDAAGRVYGREEVREAIKDEGISSPEFVLMVLDSEFSC